MNMFYLSLFACFLLLLKLLLLFRCHVSVVSLVEGSQSVLEVASSSPAQRLYLATAVGVAAERLQ